MAEHTLKKPRRLALLAFLLFAVGTAGEVLATGALIPMDPRPMAQFTNRLAKIIGIPAR